MIMLAPFSEAVGWLSTTNFTRILEPTLSWNQCHKLAPSLRLLPVARRFRLTALLAHPILHFHSFRQSLS
jgi:hypothetical protein